MWSKRLGRNPSMEYSLSLAHHIRLFPAEHPRSVGIRGALRVIPQLQWLRHPMRFPNK